MDEHTRKTLRETYGKVEVVWLEWSEGPGGMWQRVGPDFSSPEDARILAAGMRKNPPGCIFRLVPVTYPAPVVGEPIPW